MAKRWLNVDVSGLRSGSSSGGGRVVCGGLASEFATEMVVDDVDEEEERAFFVDVEPWLELLLLLESGAELVACRTAARSGKVATGSSWRGAVYISGVLGLQVGKGRVEVQARLLLL